VGQGVGGASGVIIERVINDAHVEARSHMQQHR
jgi:hypothetical protein